jgi:DNA-binding CsgD family transcriptional regulator
MLVDNDVPAARAAAEELGQIAADLDAAFLHAVSSHATGAVLLAEGNARDALSALHRACAIWRQLNAPYEAARAGILVGLASRALGDTDTATMELNAARQALEHLGAVADLKRLAELSRAPGPNPPGGLTGREVQVLRLIATGKTNRAIARDLSLSEKTVARHVSNIFTKLGLSSRAAATAYAYRHKLQ